MESVTILIVEDEAVLRMDLTHRLTQMGYRVLGSVDNGPDALLAYETKPVDLVLLDIHILGEWDGIETARRMRRVRPTPVIFLTARTDPPTINRAREVAPAAYITKPFNELNLRISIDLAIHNFALQRVADDPRAGDIDDREPAPGGETIMQMKEHVFIKQNYRFVKFRLTDILYLQSEGNYTDIITKTNKYTLRMVLNKVLERLQPIDIIRVHRSYAINLRQIDSFSDNKVLIGQYIIPVGRSYRDAFMEKFDFI